MLLTAGKYGRVSGFSSNVVAITYFQNQRDPGRLFLINLEKNNLLYTSKKFTSISLWYFPGSFFGIS